MSRKQSVSRRRFLWGTTSTITVGLLAGCSGDGEDDDGGGNGGDDDDGGNGGGGDDGETETETQTEATSQTEEVLVGPGADNTFDPDTLEIPAGTEVTFVWESSGHSLVVDSQPDGANWEGVPDTQSSGHEHTHTFDVPGTYEYHCEPHQGFGMEGTITVTES